MLDPLKKAQAGQQLEIPAEAYNAFVDAARFVRERRHDVAQESTEPLRQSGIIKVRNRSGAARDRFDVLMIDDPVVLPTANEQQFKNQVAFEGYEPSEQAHPEAPQRPVACQKFVVLLEPLPAEGIGRATVAGVTVARVNVIRESDRFAQLATGNASSLRSVSTGPAEVIWKEPGLGVKWAVVRLGERPRLAIFELAGTWQAAVPPEPDGWMKMTGCRCVFYHAGSLTYAGDAAEPTQTVWHAVGYPGGFGRWGKSGMPARRWHCQTPRVSSSPMMTTSISHIGFARRLRPCSERTGRVRGSCSWKTAMACGKSTARDCTTVAGRFDARRSTACAATVRTTMARTRSWRAGCMKPDWYPATRVRSPSRSTSIGTISFGRLMGHVCVRLELRHGRRKTDSHEGPCESLGEVLKER